MINYDKEFEDEPSLIRLVSAKDKVDDNEKMMKKLTIMANGTVSFSSFNKNRDIIESLSLNLTMVIGKEYLSEDDSCYGTVIKKL